MTDRFIGNPLHLVNHAKASLPNTTDDLVLLQLFDASIAVDAQSLGFAWLSRHDVGIVLLRRGLVSFRLVCGIPWDPEERGDPEDVVLGYSAPVDAMASVSRRVREEIGFS